MMRDAQNRREFLRAATRTVLLLGVGALGGGLWYRHRNVEVCINDSRCNGCGVYDRCGLPPAQATRQQGKGE